MTYLQMTAEKMKTSLSYFGMVNLFLFLAYKMKEFCNLTLSCQLFEEFTGYRGLFDCYFPRLKNKTTLRTTDDPLKTEISLYLEKLYGDRAPDDEDDRLDRYIVFVLDALKRRECEERDIDELSDEYLGRNKWAYAIIYEPLAIRQFKERSEGVCSQEMLDLIDEFCKR